MPPYKVFRYRVKNGKLDISKKEELRKAMSDLAGSDKEIAIAVGNYEELVTGKQLGYYWGYLMKEISIQIGHTPKELNMIFEHKFLSEGERVGDLAKPEFHNFILQIIGLVAEFNVVIYYPDEVMVPNYKELKKGAV